MTQIQIAPSLLAADPLRLGEEAHAVLKAGADWLHVDVMDGHFVPNLTFGPHVVRHLKKQVADPIDVHLMITNVDPFIHAFTEAGADYVTIHPEATYHAYRSLQLIHALGCKAGIALNPGTPVEALVPLVSEVDLVLVMTVNPGFGGQQFLMSQLSKISNIHSLIKTQSHPILLEVDGGITPEIAPSLRAAGVDVLVAGTAIFETSDYAAAIKALRG